MSFLAELRRRKVFQVAVGYLAAAWLLVQVTATILPAFDLPVWTLRFVVLLFAIGFPVAVLMAWALELTPEGVKLDIGASGGKRMLAIAAVLVAIAVGWFFHGQASQPSPAAAAGPAARVASTDASDATGTQPPRADGRSIAVLPLVNASNDPEQQFFSDGLSENLIDSLSRFQGLKVIGRISAFQFRDSKDDSATIGRKLGVSYLLGGSVQRAGDVVRVSASLVRAADGRTLWAEHYDRPYQNLFALQDEITHAVAGALQARLLSPGQAERHDDRPPSGSLEAYNAYLQGLQLWHNEEFARSSEYMATAVKLDPRYAMAWAHLSGALSTIATFDDPPETAGKHMAQARQAADKALQLAPGLGAAHAARSYLQIYTFDHRGAIAGCRRAVQLAPGDGTVLNGCGYVFAQAGKLGEAIQSRKRLLSIEPLYIINYQQYARLLIATGRLDEAERYLRIAESLPLTNPGWRSMTVFLHVIAAIARGDANAAAASAAQAPAKDRDLLTALAAQAGPDRAAADSALAGILANRAVADAHPYTIAQIQALRGDAGQAMAWLQRASVGNLLFMPMDPLVMNLRDDPRFIAFCEKTGLPPPAGIETLGIDQLRALASKPQPRP